MYDIVIKMSASHIVFPFLLRTQLGGFVCHYILIYDAFRPWKSQLHFWERRKYTGTLGKRDKSQRCAESCTTQKRVRSMRWDVHWEMRCFLHLALMAGLNNRSKHGVEKEIGSTHREIVRVYNTKSALFSVRVWVCEAGRQSCKKKVSRAIGRYRMMPDLHFPFSLGVKPLNGQRERNQFRVTSCVKAQMHSSADD